VLGFFALGLLRFVADRIHLFLVELELGCLFTAVLLLINQDNFSGDKTEQREFVGAKLMLLAFGAFVIGAVCFLGEGYSRQKTYFVKEFLPGKVVIEHTTSTDEEGEHYNTDYHFKSAGETEKEILEWVHLVIVGGTPVLLYLIAMRKWSPRRELPENS
jgi:hypothetical protein